MRLKTFLLLLCLPMMAFAKGENLEAARKSYEKGDYQAAIRQADKCIKADESNMEAYMICGNSHKALKQYVKAINVFSKAIKKNAKWNDGMLYACRADVNFLAEEYEEALADYNAAIEIDNSKSDYYYGRGELFRRMGRGNDAFADLQKAWLADKSNERYAKSYIEICSEQKRTKELQSVLDTIIKSNPEAYDAYLVRGNMYLSMGKIADASKDYITYYRGTKDTDFGAILTLASSDFDLALSLVTKEFNSVKAADSVYWLRMRFALYRSEGMYAEALKDLQTLEGLNSEMSVKTYLLEMTAECHLALKHYSKTYKVANELQALNDSLGIKSYKPFYFRGRAYFLQSKVTKSKSEFEQMKKLCGGDTLIEAYRYICMANEYLSKYDDALTVADEGIKANANASVLYMKRGQILVDYKQDTTKAKADFAKILELDTLLDQNTNRHFALAFLGRQNEADSCFEMIMDKADKKSPLLFFRAACYKARFGAKDEAISYLQEAIALGFNDFVFIINCADLKSIRETAEYDKIIKNHAQSDLKNLLDQFDM